LLSIAARLHSGRFKRSGTETQIIPLATQPSYSMAVFSFNGLSVIVKLL